MLRRWHRRLGLLLALPCLLWGLSGALLAWKNGAALRPPGRPEAVAGPRTPFRVSVEEALRVAGRPGPPEEVHFRWLLGHPRYEIRYAGAPAPVVMDGLAPRPVPAVDEALARRVAEADGGARAVSVELQVRPSLVYRRELPAYRVRLADGHDVYISLTTGQVLLHADLLTRVIRVAFFGLHLWDLSAGPPPHRSFLLLGVAALGLVALGATGLWLGLGGRWRRPRGTAPAPPRASP